MHMADALVSATVAGTMYALSAGSSLFSKKIRLENDDKKFLSWELWVHLFLQPR